MVFSGQNRLFRISVQTKSEQIDIILNACNVLISKNRGALIVFTRNLGVKGIVDSGTNKLGQKVFGENVTISSLINHPRLPHLRFGQAFGSGGSDAGRVFSLGLPAKSVDWIKNGVVSADSKND